MENYWRDAEPDIGKTRDRTNVQRMCMEGEDGGVRADVKYFRTGGIFSVQADSVGMGIWGAAAGAWVMVRTIGLVWWERRTLLLEIRGGWWEQSESRAALWPATRTILRKPPPPPTFTTTNFLPVAFPSRTLNSASTHVHLHPQRASISPFAPSTTPPAVEERAHSPVVPSLDKTASD